MHLARFMLTGSEHATQQHAELVQDSLWAHLPPGNGVEHITVTATMFGIDIAVFLSHQIRKPVEYAGKLIDAAAATSPAFQCWRR
jgi:hypothetical protein